MESCRFLNGLNAVFGLADDLQVFFGSKKGGKPRADNRMAVGDENLDLCVC